MVKHILKNGLRLILAPNNSTGVVTSLVMFGVGSRNEIEQQAGISHVLEHMNYKGTKKRPSPLEVAEFIENIGGEHNAFTSKEYTGYFVKVVPKHLESSLDFLSDILTNSLFDPTSLEREKGVIIEEINMYEDLPMEIVDSRFEEALFGKNALGRDVIGRRDSVLDTAPDDLKKYHSSHYTASNSVIVLSGNFGGRSEAAVIRLIEKYFDLPNRQSELLKPVKINQKKAFSITKKMTEQSQLIIGFHSVNFTHPDRFILKLLAVILGGSMSSRMFTEIREKRGLAYAVRTSSSSYREAGAFETQAGVPHEKVAETIKAILAEYRKVRESGVTEAELARAKEIVNGRMLVDFEDSLEVAEFYAAYETIAGELLPIETLTKLYEKVTSRDILEVAKKYLRDDRMSLAYVGPSLTEDQLKPIFKL